MKPVAELLKKRTDTAIYSVSPGATVFEAITLLAEKGVGALMVIEQGNLVGIFQSATTPARSRFWEKTRVRRSSQTS
jgi:signal-transduction protein with cAMP-binding, CBS, and nucleotidyltransferase domain